MARKTAIMVIVLILLFGGLVYFISKNPGNGIRNTVKVTATSEQRAQIEKHIQQLQDQIAKAQTDNVAKEQIFDLYVQLGDEQRTLGQLADARDTYKKAIELVPNNFIAWSTIFSAYMDMHDYDQAKIAAERALQLNGNDWNLWRGYIDLQRQQFQASSDQLKTLYKDALDATGNNINIVTVYAQYLEQIGDLNGATAMWEQAVKLEPNNPDFKAELERVKQKS